MKKLQYKFWSLTNKANILKAKKATAIKKWDIKEMDKIDKLLADNTKESDLLIEQMKEQTIKEDKPKPVIHEKFLDDNLNTVYILSNGKTLSERYITDVWRKGINLNNINLNQFKS